LTSRGEASQTVNFPLDSILFEEHSRTGSERNGRRAEGLERIAKLLFFTIQYGNRRVRSEGGGIGNKQKAKPHFFASTLVVKEEKDLKMKKLWVNRAGSKRVAKAHMA